MAIEDFSGQGSIIPTMLVGMGGVGSRVVDRIAARSRRLKNWDDRLRKLTSFVSIDTNELDQHKLRNIPEANRLNIAGFDKAKAIEHFRRSKDQQVWEWLDRSYKPRPGFKPGAGQIRVESRFGFFYHSPEIRQRLHELVEKALEPGITWRQSHPPKLNIYVFCTLAGGTGSGSFLSFAYLVDDIVRAKHWQPRVIGNFLLSTLMVDKVGPELHPDIHANTYAALKEIEHLNKLDYPEVKRTGRTEERFTFWRDENRRNSGLVKTRPFFVSFLFDRPPHLGLPDVEAAIADAAFLQLFTPIIDNLAGELDNYEKNLEELTRFPGEFRNVGMGYTKNFGAYGAAALVVPGHDLLKYCSLRFAAQALRSQITFGVDPDDVTDDRARALSRLAVDYSDPGFLRMSEEGREEKINQAFLSSVQELARQDRQEEIDDGYWNQLVESIDHGSVTGTDENDDVIRGEPLVERVDRELGAARKELLQSFSIKERAFVFHKEGINQYVELVSRLLEDIRTARQKVSEGVKGLKTAAGEGEPVVELGLDPIAERYLVIRLRERCANKWLPEAEVLLQKARKQDVDNAAVRERLKNGLYERLQEAASEGGLFKKDQAFLEARTEAQDYYRGVAGAARRVLDAEVRIDQYRGLLDFLQERSRQFSRLATRTDNLVTELEREAERLRQGDSAEVPPLALRVEVFETLDEPRRRIWDRVYSALFIDKGQFLSTFDRNVLAATITEQLKPVAMDGGRPVHKSLDRLVGDLRQALLDLGHSRMEPRIFGDSRSRGVDLSEGLEMEARLVLGERKGGSELATEDEVDEYVEKKFRALSQLAGVMARVSSAESKALDDGVKVNRTRQLILGLDPSSSAGAERFAERLSSALKLSGRQVKVDTWVDPQVAIVHDVELPIPLYYFEPVVNEVEEAYLGQMADERRGYNLHTTARWEWALPNLNPRRGEISVSWALRMLGAGLVHGVVSLESGSWYWNTGDAVLGKDELGENLSGALYRLGELSQQEEASNRMEAQIEESRTGRSEDEIDLGRKELIQQLDALLARWGIQETKGDLGDQAFLDRPVLRALVAQLKTGVELSMKPKSGVYEGLEI